jgi:hypothetical protein
LCCALVIGGGLLAAFLYSRSCRSAGAAFRPGSGAVVGLVAGLFYAIGHTALFLVLKPSPDKAGEILEQIESSGLPPEYAENAARVLEVLLTGLGSILFFCAILLVAAVFSTIGGLIGGALFKVEAAPAGPPATGAAPPPGPY